MKRKPEKNLPGMDCDELQLRLTFFKFLHFRLQNVLEQIVMNRASQEFR